MTSFAHGSEVTEESGGRGVSDSASSTEFKWFGNDRRALRKLRVGVRRHEGMVSSEDVLVRVAPRVFVTGLRELSTESNI